MCRRLFRDLAILCRAAVEQSKVAPDPDDPLSPSSVPSEGEGECAAVPAVAPPEAHGLHGEAGPTTPGSHRSPPSGPATPRATPKTEQGPAALPPRATSPARSMPLSELMGAEGGPDARVAPGPIRCEWLQDASEQIEAYVGDMLNAGGRHESAPNPRAPAAEGGGAYVSLTYAWYARTKGVNSKVVYWHSDGNEGDHQVSLTRALVPRPVQVRPLPRPAIRGAPDLSTAVRLTPTRSVFRGRSHCRLICVH